jgi:hypothetical protein
VLEQLERERERERERDKDNHKRTRMWTNTRRFRSLFEVHPLNSWMDELVSRFVS